DGTIIAAGRHTSPTPAAVATPLPPRPPRVAGHMCPATAAAPVSQAEVDPPTHSPMAAAAMPLPRSPASTASPALRPATRSVFDVPGLPDPAVVGSKPMRRPTSCAVGNVPMTYPATITATALAALTDATVRPAPGRRRFR